MVNEPFACRTRFDDEKYAIAHPPGGKPEPPLVVGFQAYPSVCSSVMNVLQEAVFSGARARYFA